MAGTSIVLGMSAVGYSEDGYALDPRGQIRSGGKLYDIAAEIHHNLPEGFIPD